MKSVNPLLSLYRHAITDINPSKRTVRHYISSDQKNEYGQILPVKGYDDKRFRKNPVVLLNHGFMDMFTTTPAKDQLAFLIANNASLSVEGEFLAAETVFLPEGQSEVSDDTFRLYESKFMHAWSKYFFPIDEPRYEPDLDAVIYPTWGIYEYSSVLIPVDCDATGNETNRLHALSLVKSPVIKNMIEARALKHELNPELESLRTELAGIKEQLNGLSGKDYSEAIGNAIKNYHNLINPKLESFKERIDKNSKELRDFAQNLDSEVEAITGKHFIKYVKETMGKVS